MYMHNVYIFSKDSDLNRFYWLSIWKKIL